MDVAEFRRKNLVPAAEFPYQTPVAFLYDSGNYEPALDRALQMIDYRKVRAEQEAARKQGRYLGIGFSTYIEACGPAPSAVAGALGAQAGLWESAQVRVTPTGKITVFTGSHSHGQGHETTFAQLAADELQVPFEDVEIVHGDTAAVPFGMGTYGSRSAAVGGSAIYSAVEKIKDKGKKIAAHLLEANEADIEYQEGKFGVRGSPGRNKTFGEVALMAYLAHNLPKGLEPGLEATSFWDPSNFVFPFGTHIVVVEVSAKTGKVKLLRYVAVDDVGRVINPMIVDGMVHGGIAQGVGQALHEYAAYDGSGQLQSGTMMDYALPRADDLVSYETDRTETPSPVNPMGIKGAGETGHHRLDGRGGQRGDGRAGAPRDHPHRHAAHAGADLVGHPGEEALAPEGGGRHVSCELRVPPGGERRGGRGSLDPPQGRRQAPGRRPQPHPDDEAAPGPAQAPRRHRTREGPLGHPGGGRPLRDRRPDHAPCDRVERRHPSRSARCSPRRRR